eukprot:CAMPEP_0185580346 /NCGR_PEP_ID=MMETSP0434-20130131/16185_1 /TAXON_ID=626734 ORGANISM="Favella taraikaensis, Strain Fe Narragansett Bay" /NCGR_SAMPLE_ID=MMETSP0434 /ASSEMBLY_ACC=CAM_ASM_000379 /LENGTH=136 /DNA_ID=CAMNT_0028198577 /DNA_START=318 /DNA_END=728 /DNA_ORIENTATION=+
MAKELAHLFEGEVSVEALVNDLLLNYFPELIILQVHGGGSLDAHEERAHGLSIECGHLLLHDRKHHVPEVGALLELVDSDLAEAESDLLRGHHIRAEPLVHIDDVGGVPGVHEHEVHLVESHRDRVVVVVVAARVN